MESYKGKRVTIMGLGLFGGGLGVTKFFAQQGADVLVTDLNAPAKLAASLDALRGFPVKYKLGYHELRDFTETDLVIVNPAVPLESPYIAAAVNAHIPLDTELNIFMRQCRSPIAAITGTNGKSTTTAWAHRIVCEKSPSALMGGNIGRSLLDMLDVTAPEVPVILEISSFQLENLCWLRKSPHVAVITNVAPNHLDRHKTMENYIAAKRAILEYQTPDDYAILNADDEIVAGLAGSTKGRVLWFSRRKPVENGACVNEGVVTLRVDGVSETLCPVAELSLGGAHNVENALAAVLVARFMAWDREGAVRALTSFNGLEHRLEFVREHKGVRYYNDSIATNPRSVVVALKAFSAPKVLIAGGYDKQLPFDEMAEASFSEDVRAVVLVGETTGKLKAAYDTKAMSSGIEIKTIPVATFAEAVDAAAAAARWGDIVLLSPGCASYGMFVNFEERGRVFKALVGKLQ
ncbi:MAG: UDP-N-acetylmuramoyl-L-alanine--D-glutamate ligase [Candidatus Brocadiia bacterium]